MATSCKKTSYDNPAFAKFMLLKLRKSARAKGKTKLPAALYPCAVTGHGWHLTSNKSAAKTKRNWRRWQLSESELAAA